MADFNVAHASSPLAIHTSVRPPEPKKVLPNPQETPKVDDAHGPAVVLGGALANKPPVKPASDAQAGDEKPNPFAPPKPGDGRPGQHVNHVI